MIATSILNHQFGELIAIKEISTGPYGKWLFRCNCGNEELKVAGYNLLRIWENELFFAEAKIIDFINNIGETK